MRMRVGAVLVLLVSLLSCGCERKRADCAASLEIRLDNVIGMTQRHLREVEMREFLWSHWHESAKYDIYTVERVQPNNPYSLNANSKVEVLPENATLSGSDYCLRFKGWGNDVFSFF